LLNQSSNRCLAFQAEFGLFLWSTGCARQTIDALFRCELSVSYDSVLRSVESLATHCILESIQVATDPHAFCYDNMNLSTSISVEQRGAAGPAKVTSGTFGILYKLRNARREDMLVAPIMKRFKLSKGLDINHDIKPSRDHLLSFQDQLIITTIQRMCAVVPAFETLAGFPLRATTIEEATVRGNLLFHDDIYLNQLKRTSESLNTNTWNRREIFQLGFGLFHLCLNLVWAILHIHRGKINEVSSLSYFFALMEKVRLGNEQPDYHSLVAALDGLLLNAWFRECASASIEAFAESKPTPEMLREIA
ncbi:hypothetical protein K438DRAFT_1499118, partial [Mycena galopus ATCC 62051]